MPVASPAGGAATARALRAVGANAYGRPVSSSSQGQPPQVTERQIKQQLGRIMRDVEGWQAAASVHTLLPPVQPGSSLAGDDRRSEPYQLSHGVEHLVGAAVEHLHGIKALVLDARVLHNSVPFTLARGAIEAGAMALWLMAPTSRAERVTRRLRQTAQDARDGTRLALEAGSTPPRPLADRLVGMEAIAQQLNGQRIALPRLTSTEVVREAERVATTPLHVMVAWQIASGFAHGRQWATLSVLDQHTDTPAESDVVRVRLTNPLRNVLWVSWVGHALVEEALQLYELRAARPL